MSRAWQTLDQRDTADGTLELRRRDALDLLICIDGRILMNSRASRSEEELGRRACEGLGNGARVLVGGLGMGLTLRAVLDALPEASEVTVAELNPIVAEWCRGPLSAVSGDALSDPRVSLRIGDVADCIRDAVTRNASYDAIILDLFEGPHARSDAERDPFYGRQALLRSWRALTPGGVFAVWAEAPDAGFEARLRAQGFRLESHRPGRGGLRHWIALAHRPPQ